MIWEGDITKIDASIQLLLIIDYICDWARSVHREAIIQELYVLAQPSPEDLSGSLTSDRWTVSSYHGRRKYDGIWQCQGASQTWLETPVMLPEEEQKKLDGISSWRATSDISGLDSKLEDNPLYQYDSLRGVIRDVMLIRSRMICLYITNTTLDELTRCRPVESQSVYILRQIKNRLKEEEPVFVEQSTLHDIEQNWTGNSRNHQVHDNPADIFQVLFTVSAYVEPDWSLTRELCVLAISESAKKLLYEKIGTVTEENGKGYMRERAKLGLSVRSSKTISRIFTPYLNSPVRETLPACLYSTSLQPKFKPHLKRLEQYDILHKRKKSGKIICAMDSSTGKRSRDIVSFLYRLHRIGSNDTLISFLRVSQRLNDHLTSESTPSTMNPWGTYRLGGSEKAILAYADPLRGFSKKVAEQARYCIFFLDFIQVDDVVRDLARGSTQFAFCNITQKISPTSTKRIDWNSSNRIKHGEHLKNATKLLDYLTETLLRKDSDDDTDENSDSEYELGSDTDSGDGSVGSENEASEEGSESEGVNVTEDERNSDSD